MNLQNYVCQKLKANYDHVLCDKPNDCLALTNPIWYCQHDIAGFPTKQFLIPIKKKQTNNTHQKPKKPQQHQKTKPKPNQPKKTKNKLRLKHLFPCTVVAVQTADSCEYPQRKNTPQYF